jgi:hypothetical protein
MKNKKRVFVGEREVSSPDTSRFSADFRTPEEKRRADEAAVRRGIQSVLADYDLRRSKVTEAIVTEIGVSALNECIRMFSGGELTELPHVYASIETDWTTKQKVIHFGITWSREL